MDVKEELIELETIQIALDDKVHRIFGELQKMKKILNHVDERLKKVKNEIPR